MVDRQTYTSSSLGNNSPTVFKKMFLTYFQRERMHGGRAERRRERTPSRFHPVSTEHNVELKLMNHDIIT